MGSTHLNALRISPKYTSDHWHALDRTSQADWTTAAKIVQDRLNGRFLRYATNALRSPHSGFAVLSIDSLLLEALQQFREGVTDGSGRSEEMITKFLAGARFQLHFTEQARTDYYKDIRCGLLHQAEAKRMWLILRDQPQVLQTRAGGGAYTIDVRLFHQAIKQSFRDYLRELDRPASDKLRRKLWTKMDHICNVRVQRGAVYAAL